MDGSTRVVDVWRRVGILAILAILCGDPSNVWDRGYSGTHLRKGVVTMTRKVLERIEFIDLRL